MKSIKGSITEGNLLKAFAGESQARNRYTFAASVAKKEGCEQISAIFQETADNEKEHAKVFFNFLEGGEAEIQASYPAGLTGNTLENLKAAAAGEKAEWTIIYQDFAEMAKQEDFPEVYTAFKQIAEVEQKHETRYNKLAANVSAGQVFRKDEVVRWKCRNCGYIFEGKEAPQLCPACKHPQAYYEVFEETY
ncbi:MAG: rubrerythrin family protein [Coprothermobacterota bacterium]|nr:rubrerythrin family protein [Coprothermobacterota bacterium]